MKEKEVGNLIKSLLDEKFGVSNNNDNFNLKYTKYSWIDEFVFEKSEYLLSLNNKIIYKYLWNSIPMYEKLNYDEFKKLDKKKYPPLVLEILNKRADAYINVRKGLIFSNSFIETKRLILRRATEKDIKIIDDAFKMEGSFFMEQCYLKNTKGSRNIILNNILLRPNYYIIESKDNKRVIGYVAINVYGREHIGNIEYYILKEYRKNGFCKEACKSIIDVAFKGNLIDAKRTSMRDVYKIKKIKVSIIKASCLQTNAESNATLKSLGFVYSGFDFKGTECESNVYVTENLYYLENNI